MNKLTREQADLLIEEIGSKIKHRVTGDLCLDELKEPFIYPIDVENVINQCTEKKFPYVWVDLYEGWSVVVRQNGALVYLETLCGGVTKQVSASFDRKEFEKLTKGFAEIVEWMHAIL